ncbi:GNAT family N-acetyltransferase, partial [Streptomyces parvus]|uniref:GNAT family N-acetyltransferase n=1 Tax=Streptomyces parvus TaxID=66428 RepID=UPI00344B8089
MDLTIRAAEPAEYAVLGGIIAEAYLGDDLLDGPQDPYLLKLQAVEQRAVEAEVLVALDADGAVLGGVTYAAPGTPWRDIAGPDEAEFRMLAVARAGRGRGVGEALVRAFRSPRTDPAYASPLCDQSPDRVSFPYGRPAARSF